MQETPSLEDFLSAFEADANELTAGEAAPQQDQELAVKEPVTEKDAWAELEAAASETSPKEAPQPEEETPKAAAENPGDGQTQPQAEVAPVAEAASVEEKPRELRLSFQALREADLDETLAILFDDEDILDPGSVEPVLEDLSEKERTKVRKVLAKIIQEYQVEPEQAAILEPVAEPELDDQAGPVTHAEQVAEHNTDTGEELDDQAGPVTHAAAPEAVAPAVAVALEDEEPLPDFLKEKDEDGKPEVAVPEDDSLPDWLKGYYKEPVGAEAAPVEPAATAPVEPAAEPTPVETVVEEAAVAPVEPAAETPAAEVKPDLLKKLSKRQLKLIGINNEKMQILLRNVNLSDDLAVDAALARYIGPLGVVARTREALEAYRQRLAAQAEPKAEAPVELAAAEVAEEAPVAPVEVAEESAVPTEVEGELVAPVEATPAEVPVKTEEASSQNVLTEEELEKLGLSPEAAGLIAGQNIFETDELSNLLLNAVKEKKLTARQAVEVQNKLEEIKKSILLQRSRGNLEVGVPVAPVEAVLAPEPAAEVSTAPEPVTEEVAAEVPVVEVTLQPEAESGEARVVSESQLAAIAENYFQSEQARLDGERKKLEASVLKFFSVDRKGGKEKNKPRLVAAAAYDSMLKREQRRKKEIQELDSRIAKFLVLDDEDLKLLHSSPQEKQAAMSELGHKKLEIKKLTIGGWQEVLERVRENLGKQAKVKAGHLAKVVDEAESLTEFQKQFGEASGYLAEQKGLFDQRQAFEADEGKMELYRAAEKLSENEDTGIDWEARGFRAAIRKHVIMLVTNPRLGKRNQDGVTRWDELQSVHQEAKRLGVGKSQDFAKVIDEQGKRGEAPTLALQAISLAEFAQKPDGDVSKHLKSDADRLALLLGQSALELKSEVPASLAAYLPKVEEPQPAKTAKAPAEPKAEKAPEPPVPVTGDEREGGDDEFDAKGRKKTKRGKRGRWDEQRRGARMRIPDEQQQAKQPAVPAEAEVLNPTLAEKVLELEDEDQVTLESLDSSIQMARLLLEKDERYDPRQVLTEADKILISFRETQKPAEDVAAKFLQIISEKRERQVLLAEALALGIKKLIEGSGQNSGFADEMKWFVSLTEKLGASDLENSDLFTKIHTCYKDYLVPEK